MGTSKLAFQGIEVLTPAGWVNDATVLIEEGRFIRVDSMPLPYGFTAQNGTGLRMLPGIVDIHGDAFERMICPRPGVTFPLEMAIVENDRALLAAGITTFYYSITDSFEPGLRSRETARRMIETILKGKNYLRVNSQIHIRHEQSNTADYDELCQWIETKIVTLLSLNNHLPPSTNEDALGRYSKGLRQRIKLSDLEIKAMIEGALERQMEGLQQLEDLVQRAHTAQVPVASHDDDSEEKVALSARRKMAIAEFPASIELAAQSQAYGAAVLMGAPNLVRGGSHVGFMSVAAATKAGVVDCLCSDYHYPSLFHAPFKIAEMELMEFSEAWKLVSTHPAKAVGLGDRKGAIAPGLEADFVLVKPEHDLPSAIVAVYVQGKEVARFAGG